MASGMPMAVIDFVRVEDLEPEEVEEEDEPRIRCQLGRAGWIDFLLFLISLCYD